ncbi:MAG: hypothetical protein JF887_00700 [Candidatus Dormibacteraeota bacterium]|uniref:Uncharacterized protein n=1 Tax=Candidatus Amunia macphersoniae TaxID=3127014 RepID=A0A934KK00_9BACT|nr:hypothetical protein [Candidatus Dormibacteraeota bacterium]
MSDETNDPAATTADEAAERTHEGNAHADHEETGEQTRGSLQRWGANSPGSNAIPATGDSPPSDDTGKLPNES